MKNQLESAKLYYLTKEDIKNGYEKMASNAKKIF